MKKVSFDEQTSREIAALATEQGITTEQYIQRYVIDVHTSVSLRGGVEALEDVNASNVEETEARTAREKQLEKAARIANSEQRKEERAERAKRLEELRAEQQPEVVSATTEDTTEQQ